MQCSQEVAGLAVVPAACCLRGADPPPPPSPRFPLDVPPLLSAPPGTRGFWALGCSCEGMSVLLTGVPVAAG